jgi:uncharacterized protein YxjI
MEIDITQKKISVGDKYQIFIDGQQAYAASQQLVSLLPEINLFETSAGGRARITINKKFAWFKAAYDITRWDNNVFQFRTRSIWKVHFQCQSGSDNYDIYGHRGRKYSIFKNNIQVAWWDKKAVSWFAGDNYKIRADNECDIELIVSFCLVIDNFASNHKGGNTITFDLGNLGLQAKKFDNTWLPK